MGAAYFYVFTHLVIINLPLAQKFSEKHDDMMAKIENTHLPKGDTLWIPYLPNPGVLQAHKSSPTYHWTMFEIPMIGVFTARAESWSTKCFRAGKGYTIIASVGAFGGRRTTLNTASLMLIVQIASAVSVSRTSSTVS